MAARPVGIVVAVREEFGAVSRRLAARRLPDPLDRSAVAGVLGGKDIVLVRSGMGADRAAAAVRRLVARDGIAHLVIAGFCAGLRAGVEPGDVVVATRVDCAETGARLTPHLDARQAGPPGDRRYRVLAGDVLTSSSIAGGPARKRELGAEFPEALALDMETAGAASAACEVGLPWVAVRAVTDGAGHTFPLDFSRLYDSATGDVRRAVVVGYVLLHPWLVPALAQLGVRSARAARNLALCVEEYVGVLANTEPPHAG